MKNIQNRDFGGNSTYDNSSPLCRADDKAPSLPTTARLPINRCNLPPIILGSLTYQQHPTPLELDGVAELHRDLFRRLNATACPGSRATVFQDYVTVHFCLDCLEEAGLTSGRKARARANYIRMLRGWSFDSDSREGAVMKGWVESRFGLTPQYHGDTLRDPAAPAYSRYLESRSQGLYGTNALEAQMDLVYAYCQYEFARQSPTLTHIPLYRGINHLGEHEQLGYTREGQRIMLFNNLNSFTRNRERAGEFGDYILTVQVPVAKLLFHCQLLPGILQGEDEFLVIGGVYGVDWSTL